MSRKKPVNLEVLRSLLEKMDPSQWFNCLLSMAHKQTFAAEMICEFVLEDISQRKLFIRFFSGTPTIESLRLCFEEFGMVEDVAIIYDHQTGKSKGFGFVTFQQAQSAQCALVNPLKNLEGKMCEVSYVSMTKELDHIFGGTAAMQASAQFQGNHMNSFQNHHTSMQNMPRGGSMGNQDNRVSFGSVSTFASQNASGNQFTQQSFPSGFIHHGSNLINQPLPTAQLHMLPPSRFQKTPTISTSFSSQHSTFSSQPTSFSAVSSGTVSQRDSSIHNGSFRFSPSKFSISPANSNFMVTPTHYFHAMNNRVTPTAASEEDYDQCVENSVNYAIDQLTHNASNNFESRDFSQQVSSQNNWNQVSSNFPSVATTTNSYAPPKNS